MSGDRPLHPREVEFDPRHVLEVLARHHVRYVLIGGVAARLHGSPLRTDDLDLTPDPDPANLQRLVDALQELGAQSASPARQRASPCSYTPPGSTR